MNGKRGDWESGLNELPLGSGGFSSHTMKKVKERIKLLDRRARRKKQIVAASIVILLGTAALVFRDGLEERVSAMLKPRETVKPVISETETTTLRILYRDNSTFMTMYGQPFIIRHPSVRFEYADYAGGSANVYGITPGLETYKKQLINSHADLVQVPLAYVSELSAAGLLKPLDAWMKRDGVSEDNWDEAVRQTQREAGNGELFGFAPEFTAFALFYNRKLFEANGIASPTDGMTWDEVLQTAAQFQGLKKNDKPVYGLSFGYTANLAMDVLTVGESQGLRLADAQNRQATTDAPSWTALWEKMAAGHQEGWINNALDKEWKGSIPMSELYKNDPFLTGQSAMTYQANSYMNNISEATSSISFKEDWAVVAQPKAKDHRLTDAAFEVPYVFAIPAQSANADAAWELLKYIMSPEQAKRFARFPSGSLPTAAAGTTLTDSDKNAVFYRAAVDPAEIVANAQRNADPVYANMLLTFRTAAYNQTQALRDSAIDVPALLHKLQETANQSLAAGPKGETQP